MPHPDSGLVPTMDCRKSFLYFRKNFDAASLSTYISNDIENMDLFRIYHYFLAKFTHDMPKYIHDRLFSGDAKGLTSMWTARQMWKSRLMEQLLQPYKRRVGYIGAIFKERYVTHNSELLGSSKRRSHPRRLHACFAHYILSHGPHDQRIPRYPARSRAL